MSVWCGMCKLALPADLMKQLLPCLHTFCGPCLQKHAQKNKVCPVAHCYSSVNLPPDIKWNPCENEHCPRKLSMLGEVFRTACQHELCVQCVDDANKVDNPLCPVSGCGAPLHDEDEKEACAGKCGATLDPEKLNTIPCCQYRMCDSCFNAHTEGKGVCPPGKCQPLEKRQKKGKKSVPVIKTPCAGQPDCEGEVLRNFPSEKECEHVVCVSCLSKTLDECAANNTTPICPADSCRLPYRCETVIALRALFPERAAFFNRFDLESHYSSEALKDDTVMYISGDSVTRNANRLMECKVCFCEDEENQHSVEYDENGPLGDFIREIRRVLSIMPWDKVYGYFRRDGDAEKQMVVKPKKINTTLKELQITKDTMILVDITGIVNSKAADKSSQMLPPTPKK